MSVRVYVCVCMYVYMNVCVHVYVCVCIYESICLCGYVCVCVCWQMTGQLGFLAIAVITVSIVTVVLVMFHPSALCNIPFSLSVTHWVHFWKWLTLTRSCPFFICGTYLERYTWLSFVAFWFFSRFVLASWLGSNRRNFFFDVFFSTNFTKFTLCIIISFLVKLSVVIIVCSRAALAYLN